MVGTTHTAKNTWTNSIETNTKCKLDLLLSKEQRTVILNADS